MFQYCFSKFSCPTGYPTIIYKNFNENVSVKLPLFHYYFVFLHHVQNL